MGMKRYKTEVGAGSNNSPGASLHQSLSYHPADAMTDYLADVYHSSAVCDRCMQRIHGAWFRCAYCAKDLCWICEEMDTHNEKHIFIVFKSPVNLSVFRSVSHRLFGVWLFSSFLLLQEVHGLGASDGRTAVDSVPCLQLISSVLSPSSMFLLILSLQHCILSSQSPFRIVRYTPRCCFFVLHAMRNRFQLLF